MFTGECQPTSTMAAFSSVDVSLKSWSPKSYNYYIICVKASSRADEETHPPVATQTQVNNDSDDRVKNNTFIISGSHDLKEVACVRVVRLCAKRI
jgi:hypothetical protein